MTLLVMEETETEQLVVSELSAGNRQAWDSYVLNSSGGLPMHLSGWQEVMGRTYGYETRYLMAARGDEIAGVLPLMVVPSILTGKRAMSVPGGLCADSEFVEERLVDRALALLTGSSSTQLQLQDSRQQWHGEWQINSDHVYWLVDLRLSEEDLWNRLDGNIRRQVRKARKADLTTEIDRSGRLLDPFYEVFSRFTHQAGTPVFGRSFLQNVVNTFPGGFNIAVVWHDHTPIAGYFQLEMGDTIYGMWGAALSEYRNYRPSYLAIWDMMSDAIKNGSLNLDMGRSPADTNMSKFKGQWGGKSGPVYQLVRGIGESANIMNVSAKVQSENRYQLFSQLWSKMPLSMTRYFGPKLRWHIPFA